ncbi:MAG: FtsH protease activity modulator HflK [Candidatus Cloacimonetes bacterium]|nr:FtsH protease activity modulator HflK [Candidatus Cloacimonadota bacterium]MCF7815050.1 FtsH protease activity modulator HflK [Candidatus Cloacimonadota bacterium]MCF7868557.1 FtsH protease activity modulator HflK [Candidatus Cloacimonadota bacterium]MCF7884269.1 FtsH protease activity modulator HflK [Candidatus Cloacimonadota bacterium]
MADFEEIKASAKIPKIPKKRILTIVIIIAVAIFILTGLYTVNPEELGVIQRFGKYVVSTEPGLHFKIPFGVDKLTKVKVKEVFKEEFGFRTMRAGVKSQFSRRNFDVESVMLTGDLNIADVEWIIQYRIKDPVRYLFNVRNVEETIRDLTESVIREVVGDRSVDEVIVLNRKEIADEAEILLQKELNYYKAGVEVVTINLQNVNPPERVRPAFNEVNSAKQEKERIINQAWQKYNEIIPEARGKAKRTIEEAQGYAINRVNRANGDADRFMQMYNTYKNAKTVTRKRMYLETMQKILPNVEKVYIVDEEQKGLLPLLDLNDGGK